MKVSALILASVLAFGLVTFAQEVVRPADIGADHVGNELAVEGRVYSINKTGAGMHLYFGADTSSAFQGLIPASSIYKFKVDIEKRYSRRNVRITGKVEEERGKFFIRVADPKQIRVVPRKRSTKER